MSKHTFSLWFLIVLEPDSLWPSHTHINVTSEFNQCPMFCLAVKIQICSLYWGLKWILLAHCIHFFFKNVCVLTDFSVFQNFLKYFVFWPFCSSSISTEHVFGMNVLWPFFTVCDFDCDVYIEAILQHHLVCEHPWCSFSHILRNFLVYLNPLKS